jgi:hypothetical protein
MGVSIGPLQKLIPASRLDEPRGDQHHSGANDLLGASLYGGQEFGAEVVAQLPCHIDEEPPRRLDAAADRGDGRVEADRE